jgi:hypothetical protein
MLTFFSFIYDFTIKTYNFKYNQQDNEFAFFKINPSFRIANKRNLHLIIGLPLLTKPDG